MRPPASALLLAPMLLAWPLAPLPAASPQARPLPAAPFDSVALEAVLQEEMRALRAPGVAIAVVQRGRVVYQRGFGVASAETTEPVTPATLFRIGSTTKMVTGLTAAVLAHEGRLALDRPIGGYARGLSPMLARRTLDQLLTHAGGMTNEASGAGPHDDAALGARARLGRGARARPGRRRVRVLGSGLLAGRLRDRAGGRPPPAAPVAPAAPASEARFVGSWANGADTLRIARGARGLTYTYGPQTTAARLDGADAIAVLGADGSVAQRFLLVSGRTSGRPYLHDGLSAFARVEVRARSAAGR